MRVPTPHTHTLLRVRIRCAVPTSPRNAHASRVDETAMAVGTMLGRRGCDTNRGTRLPASAFRAKHTVECNVTLPRPTSHAASVFCHDDGRRHVRPCNLPTWVHKSPERPGWRMRTPGEVPCSLRPRGHDHTLRPATFGPLPDGRPSAPPFCRLAGRSRDRLPGRPRCGPTRPASPDAPRACGTLSRLEPAAEPARPREFRAHPRNSPPVAACRWRVPRNSVATFRYAFALEYSIFPLPSPYRRPALLPCRLFLASACGWQYDVGDTTSFKGHCL